MEDFTFRLACADDKPAITKFMHAHWGQPHPLVELPQQFDYYYKSKDGSLRFALAYSGKTLAAIAGYIPANSGAKPDVWVSIWVADPAVRGAGLELMQAMPKLLGCRTLCCNNIRPKTRAFYHFLCYQTGQMQHWYRLAEKAECKIAQGCKAETAKPKGGAKLTLLKTPGELKNSGFKPPEAANPLKDEEYIIKRYFNYPGWQYRLYAAEIAGRKNASALVALRLADVTEENGEKIGTVLRVVDYIGEADFFAQLGTALNALLKESDAEYMDCYCAGLPEKAFEEAGFTMRIEGGEEVIPHYLDPISRENIEYYYFTNNSENFTMFRADGDQDRPNGM